MSASTRRQVLKGGGWAALGGWLSGQATAQAIAPADQSAAATRSLGPGAGSRNTYASLGVTPLINARGTVTIVGASRVLPEVTAAMEAASREYVQLDELAEALGPRLGELTGAEWGTVTSGASAAITLATAAAIAGSDPDRMVQLPDLRGLPDEVIMPSYSRSAYDHAIKVAGARILEVRDASELEAAFGPRTAMVYVMAGARSQDGPMSLADIVALAKPRGVPVLVDAAADALVVPNPYLGVGADAVAYSGGKCLRGPQCSGLLIGQKSLVQAAWINSAPHHGLGRGFKVGREEMMGLLAAVEAWMRTRDHAAEQRQWTAWLEYIAGRLASVDGVTTEIRQPRGLSNRTPSLRVRWDQTKIPFAGDEVVTMLLSGEPRVAVSGAGSFLPFPPDRSPSIDITPYQLADGEERIIASRVLDVLSSRPGAKAAASGTADVSGQWDVALQFVRGSSRCSFALEQQGALVNGTHYGSFATRDLAGTIEGRSIVLRSSYTQNGVRLNFTFTGEVDDAAMAGDVSLGEYGTATWRATRRTYR